MTPRFPAPSGIQPCAIICNLSSGTFVSTASALFVDPVTHNYQLKVGSPAIDAGVNLSPDVVADINGLPRPQRAAYDIGCYEMP